MPKRKGFASVLLLAIVLVIGAVLAGGYFIVGQKISSKRVSSSGVVSTLLNTISKSSPAPSAGGQTETIDVHAIPLGDGKVSNSPKAGYVYSCQQNFKNGAEHAGDWISGNTWDMTKKISVEGSVSWPSASFSDTLSGIFRQLLGNGLPVGSNTGVFPIRSTDQAYQYDRNPNSIKSYDVSYQLPADPQMASKPSCVPMGAIGYALNGVAIYNALDASGRDVVAHEVQDSCDGHPQEAGQYHYHGPSSCIPHFSENNALVGYALDGFGIYSMHDAKGREYTNDDLDVCHGTTSEISWDGKTVNMYHYVLTQGYPYTIGCFKGTPVKVGGQQQMQGNQNGPGGLKPPPPRL